MTRHFQICEGNWEKFYGAFVHFAIDNDISFKIGKFSRRKSQRKCMIFWISPYPRKWSISQQLLGLFQKFFFSRKANSRLEASCTRDQSKLFFKVLQAGFENPYFTTDFVYKKYGLNAMASLLPQIFIDNLFWSNRPLLAIISKKVFYKIIF